MFRPTTHIIFSLLLLSGCIDFRSLPSDDPLVFAAHVQDPQDQYFKPGTSVELPLTLASEEEALREEKFQVLSATLADGTDVHAHVTHDEDITLTLNENTLRYTPQAPGDHTLSLRIGLDWEPEGAQETVCRIHVPAAPWRVRGIVNAAGALSFKVDGVDDRWREETWTLLPHQAWSAGVTGTLHNLSGSGDIVWEVEEETTLSYGENNALRVNLTESSLDDPKMRFTVQGPDQTEREVLVDLLPLCVAHLQDGMGKVERNLAGKLAEVGEHMHEVEGLYTLEEETVLTPNRNKERERKVKTCLATLERDKTVYDRELAWLATLDRQDPKHASRQLPAFQSAQKRLEDAIRCLKSTKVQLQAQCTSAHEALNKVVRTGEDAQEAIHILLEDPRLEVNSHPIWPPLQIQNTGYYTKNPSTYLPIVSSAIENKYVFEKLLQRGANIEKTYNNGIHSTALGYALCIPNKSKRRIAVERLLKEGANVEAEIKVGRDELIPQLASLSLLEASILTSDALTVAIMMRNYRCNSENPYSTIITDRTYADNPISFSWIRSMFNVKPLEKRSKTERLLALGKVRAYAAGKNLGPPHVPLELCEYRRLGVASIEDPEATRVIELLKMNFPNNREYLEVYPHLY